MVGEYVFEWGYWGVFSVELGERGVALRGFKQCETLYKTITLPLYKYILQLYINCGLCIEVQMRVSRNMSQKCVTKYVTF